MHSTIFIHYYVYVKEVICKQPFFSLTFRNINYPACRGFNQWAVSSAPLSPQRVSSFTDIYISPIVQLIEAGALQTSLQEDLEIAPLRYIYISLYSMVSIQTHPTRTRRALCPPQPSHQGLQTPFLRTTPPQRPGALNPCTAPLAWWSPRSTAFTRRPTPTRRSLCYRAAGIV